jgi:hypothetical protein
MDQNNSSNLLDITTGTFYNYTLIITLIQQCYGIFGFIFNGSITYITIKNKYIKY